MLGKEGKQSRGRKLTRGPGPIRQLPIARYLGFSVLVTFCAWLIMCAYVCVTGLHIITSSRIHGSEFFKGMGIGSLLWFLSSKEGQSFLSESNDLCCLSEGQ